MGLIIATPKLSDAAVLTAGSAAANMPVTNLQLVQPTDVWRAIDLANSYVVADLGAAAAITLAALLDTNASSAATWRIRAATSEANLTAAPGYDSGSLTHWLASGLGDWETTHAVKTFAAQNFRWWRIDVSDAANPDGYYQAGRLYLAVKWEPTGNIKVREGMSLRWLDPSPIAQTISGHRYPDIKRRRRVLEFGLGYLSEAEMWGNAAPIDRLRGTSKDLLISRDPAHASYAQEWTVYGLLHELTPIVFQEISQYARRFEIEELI